MSNEWFSSKLAPDGDVEDGCHPEEAQAMKNFLHQQTNAVKTAQAITQPLTNAENPREDVPRLWGFLTDALLELPSEKIDALIALLQAIDDLPEPNFEAIEESNRPHEKLWKGLPGFGHQWADLFQGNDLGKDAGTSDSTERDKLIQKHLRRAEIEARLVMGGLGGIPIDWGYEAVADALESSNAVLEFEVPAASKWLEICGQRFRQGAGNNEKSWALKPRSTKLSSTPQRDFWKAPTDQVMSLERWSLWEQRLKNLQAESPAIRDAANLALDAMSKIQ